MWLGFIRAIAYVSIIRACIQNVKPKMVEIDVQDQYPFYIGFFIAVNIKLQRLRQNFEF